MRATFIKTLVEIAKNDERVVLLTGDLGYMALEPFIKSFPGRFFNVGVAEQNMAGLATGLAEAGFIPFIYSIATFATLRPYEFIRNGPIHQNLKVRIVGTGGGFEYGHNGITHHAIEDVGIMRIQPGISIVVPADFEQTRTALLSTWDRTGPVYYRIGKDETTIIPGLNGSFKIGAAQLINRGKDVLLISMGSITVEAVKAVELLKKRGIEASLMVISNLNPDPVEDIVKELNKCKLAVTVESHYVSGGIGSLVSEIAAENKISCRVIRCGVRKIVDGISGSQSYMQHLHGLSAEKIAETVAAAKEGYNE